MSSFSFKDLTVKEVSVKFILLHNPKELYLFLESGQ